MADTAEDMKDRLIKSLQAEVDAVRQRYERDLDDLWGMSLFWSKHADDDLRDAMYVFNTNPYGGPQCRCLKCRIAGRVDTENYQLPESGVDTPCTFTGPFMEVLKSVGLDNLAYGSHAEVVGAGATLMHPSARVMSCVFTGVNRDADFHLANDDPDFTMFSYGPAIWRCKSIREDKIKRLKNLFCILEGGRPDEEMGTAAAAEGGMKAEPQ